MRTAGMRVGVAAIVLAGVLGLSGGCAYFNLFYNAEEAFDEAEAIGEFVEPSERPSTTQRQQYQRAIRKARMLLEEYPESDLVDDALFLIGKSHLRLKEWSDALQNLDNLLVNFPSSEFVEEAMYLKSLAHFGRGEEQLGLEWFARLGEGFPEGRYTAEAIYRLGEAYARDGRHEQAISFYQDFLTRYEDRDDASSARLALARSLLAEDQIDEAIEELGRIDPERMSEAELFEAERLRVETLLEADRAQDAAEFVTALPELALDDRQRDEALLLEGRVLLEVGRVDEGYAALESLAEDASSADVLGQAWYTMIEFALGDGGPDSEVLDEKIDGAKGKSLGVWSTQIGNRSRQVEAFDALVQEAVADTLSEADRADAAHRLAELLLFDFDRPADAIPRYEQVLQLTPDSDLAPRAAYAIGWIQEERLGNQGAAEAAFALLEERYPDSAQARSRRGEQFLTVKERTDEELEAVVEERLRQIGAGGGATVGGVAANDPRYAPLRSLQNGGPGAFTPRLRGGR